MRLEILKKYIQYWSKTLCYLYWWNVKIWIASIIRFDNIFFILFGTTCFFGSIFISISISATVDDFFRLALLSSVRFWTFSPMLSLSFIALRHLPRSAVAVSQLFVLMVSRAFMTRLERPWRCSLGQPTDITPGASLPYKTLFWIRPSSILRITPSQVSLRWVSTSTMGRPPSARTVLKDAGNVHCHLGRDCELGVLPSTCGKRTKSLQISRCVGCLQHAGWQAVNDCGSKVGELV